ncbi:glycosyltransferase [Kineococcus sp. GCM10028916]|uniref:glycosyltransferase n=1 Tax=Kineococcus sp. GCM10028916 TaxID=3273394 RepID=UPI0036285636
MADIQHVVLTRYNLPIPGSIRGLDPEWLETRLELFRRFCVPSVLSQREQRFTWLVLMDSRTPPPAISAVETLLPRGSRVLLLDAPLDDSPLHEKLIGVGFSPELPLLSSRLDNDDCLGRNYTRLVRAAAIRSGGAVAVAINLPLGVQVQAGRAYGLVDFDNPFVSLLETVAPWRTVLAVSHREVRRLGPLRQVVRPAEWMQVVHQDNLDNLVRGVRIPRKIALPMFTPPVRPTLPAGEQTVEVVTDAFRGIVRVARRGVRRVRSGSGDCR